ncbi:hypothetical protein WJX77_004267 [Trebouxia sp. C0004]
MINLLVWLLAFLMQAGLLGIVMYSLISLSDLENDFVNPHDSSAALNKWVVSTLACIALKARIYLQREHIVDVTEIFRQLPKQKMMRMIKLVIFLFSFVLIIYRTVETLIIFALDENNVYGGHTPKEGIVQ